MEFPFWNEQQVGYSFYGNVSGILFMCVQYVDAPGFIFFNKNVQEKRKQEGFLPCQTPTPTVRLKVEGYMEGIGLRVKNGGCKIKSEE